MMEKLNIIIEWISEFSGFSPVTVKWFGIALLLFLLLMALRKPWKMVQLAIVLALLGSLAYVGYDLTKAGSSHKKKLIENPMEEMKKIGD